MAEKCPVCGAPLENNKCSYCNYEKPVERPVQTMVNNSIYYQPPNQSQPKTQVETFRVVIDANVPKVSDKNKVLALILCIFLGMFGVHHFYVGKVGMGILYLFTVGLFGIGWFIDIIMILAGAFKDSKGLPVKQ